MKRLILSICMLFSTLLIAGPEISEAEKAFQNKDYKKAITQYHHFLKKYPQNAQLLYNLGSAYYKHSEIGLSIAYFKKALLLKPRDKDIRFNIKLVRKSVVDQTQQKGWSFRRQMSKTMNFFRLDELLIVGIICLSLLSGSVYFLRKKLWFGHALTLILVACSLSWTILFLKYNSMAHEDVVVIQKKVTVKSGPSSTLETLFYIHEGVEGSHLKTINGWTELQLDNGFRGWVKSEEIMRISL